MTDKNTIENNKKHTAKDLVGKMQIYVCKITIAAAIGTYLWMILQTGDVYWISKLNELSFSDRADVYKTWTFLVIGLMIIDLFLFIVAKIFLWTRKR